MQNKIAVQNVQGGIVFSVERGSIYSWKNAEILRLAAPLHMVCHQNYTKLCHKKFFT